MALIPPDNSMHQLQNWTTGTFIAVNGASTTPGTQIVSWNIFDSKNTNCQYYSLQQSADGMKCFLQVNKGKGYLSNQGGKAVYDPMPYLLELEPGPTPGQFYIKSVMEDTYLTLTSADNLTVATFTAKDAAKMQTWTFHAP